MRLLKRVRHNVKDFHSCMSALSPAQKSNKDSSSLSRLYNFDVVYRLSIAKGGQLTGEGQGEFEAEEMDFSLSSGNSIDDIRVAP